jgi:hypothetical protein
LPLIARWRPSTEVFAEAARQVGELLGAESAWMDRYDRPRAELALSREQFVASS